MGVLQSFEKFVFCSIFKIAPTTPRNKEMSYSEFQRSGIRRLFLLGEPLLPRATFFRTLVSVPGTVASQSLSTSGAVSNNNISFGFIAQDLVVKRFGVAFLHGLMTFEKMGLVGHF